VPPYIYAPEEIAALLDAARQLTPALRAATVEAVIGLMASTGLRRGEALALDRHDVDLDDGALHVRAGKQSKQREVPLHATTTQALREYARVRARHCPTPSTPAFFIITSGARLTASAFGTAFVTVIKRVGLEGCGQRPRPRPHDLRHYVDGGVMRPV
jgi:integrase